MVPVNLLSEDSQTSKAPVRIWERTELSLGSNITQGRQNQRRLTSMGTLERTLGVTQPKSSVAAVQVTPIAIIRKPCHAYKKPP